MASDFDQRLSAIEIKAQLLVERYNLVNAERMSLREKVCQLEQELNRSAKTIETLKTKIEYLQMASTILPTGEEVEHSRQFLSELVWEIDKCIAQLSE